MMTLTQLREERKRVVAALAEFERRIDEERIALRTLDQVLAECPEEDKKP